MRVNIPPLSELCFSNELSYSTHDKALLRTLLVYTGDRYQYGYALVPCGKEQPAAAVEAAIHKYVEDCAYDKSEYLGHPFIGFAYSAYQYRRATSPCQWEPIHLAMELGV